MSAIGNDIYELARDLFPIPRSLTGSGVRETLHRLGRHIDLTINEIPTGTQVFDWAIPREWNVDAAYIARPDGTRIIDMQNSSLHVLGYSIPMRARLPLRELRQHIFTLPDQPELIPYRTSYYTERWGFCMSHRQLETLDEGPYDVVIDSHLEDGSLTYGEYLHRGSTNEEVLLTAHVCHPALANDNCSGLALLTMLAKSLIGSRTRLSYRFLFAPGTIGAIAWLARNEKHTSLIRHGLVVSCVGDAGGPTYKRSRRGDALIDRAMTHVLLGATPAPTVLPFSPYGYDERQFCSPGFNLPIGLFQRSQYGTFPEYHTSADNMDFIKPEHLEASYRLIKQALDVLEQDRRVISTCQKGEPQLGRRGLYGAIGGDKNDPAHDMAMLWVMNLADGSATLLDMAERANLPFPTIAQAATRLETAGLLRASNA